VVNPRSSATAARVVARMIASGTPTLQEPSNQHCAVHEPFAGHEPRCLRTSLPRMRLSFSAHMLGRRSDGARSTRAQRLQSCAQETPSQVIREEIDNASEIYTRACEQDCALGFRVACLDRGFWTSRENAVSWLEYPTALPDDGTPPQYCPRVYDAGCSLTIRH
jgi:hypothetical protein